jgi:hypothetical protein
MMMEGALQVSMRRRPHCSLPLLVAAVVLTGALIVAGPNCAPAQETSGIPHASTHGIRHILYLTIKSDPDSRFIQPNSGEPLAATLTVNTRISAHSQETNFYGEVAAMASNFDPFIGSREQEVWKDAKCHHERGIPKISVINVDGSITNGQTKLPIAARFRWIGRLLPGDEVMAGKRLSNGTDAVGPFIATRTQTRQSRLFVDLKLYILPCDLSVKHADASEVQPMSGGTAIDQPRNMVKSVTAE